MRVLPPKVLTYRSHWLPGTAVAVLLTVVGLGLLFTTHGTGETLVGMALIGLAIAALIDRRVLRVDAADREVRYSLGVLGLLLPARRWSFEAFQRVVIRAGGGSAVGGARSQFHVKLEGPEAALQVPLRCATVGDARMIAGEIAETMRLLVDAAPADSDDRSS